MVLRVTDRITFQLVNMLQKEGIAVLSNLELRMEGFVLVREYIKPVAEFRELSCYAIMPKRLIGQFFFGHISVLTTCKNHR